MSMQIEDVEATIKNEIEQGAKQNDIAQTYALGLRSTAETDWAAVNHSIIKRWSVAGLLKIKKLAHSGKCFK